ncbi:MAG: SDR family oxidoreductase [Alkalispirochaeta sp.]
MKNNTAVAYLTGGARGIGRACAAFLKERGYRTVIVDFDEESLERTRAEIDVDLALFVDLRDETQIRESIRRTVDEFSRIDAVINNAAVSRPSEVPPDQLPLDEWRRVIETNLTAPFLVVKHAADTLRRHRGSVVNIASTRALQSEPDSEAYAASKGGLLSLTHALAISLGPDVRVNAISPGWIDTTGEPISSEDHRQHPAGRVGVPEDVAAMVAYLISPEASFVTGQNFVIDGGMTKKMIYR